MCSGFRGLSSDWVKSQRNDEILTVTNAKTSELVISF